MRNEYLAWFDGACEPVNPGGTATFGVVIKDKDCTVLLKEHGLVGKGSQMSDNVAEYGGVLHILKYLSSRPPGRVTIHGDSNLVINQLKGKWRIRKGLYRSIAIEANELLAHLHGLGWQVSLSWVPREQNEECDALSKKGCHTAGKPSSTARKMRKGKDPRDALMIGRTIKTTRITVLRADPSRGADWWLCRCSCSREFVAHGWGVRHGRTRHCGGPDHVMQLQDYPVAAITMPAPSACLQASHASEPGRQAMASCSSQDILHHRSTCPARSGSLTVNPSLPGRSVA
jgi:ribonuclease HI